MKNSNVWATAACLFVLAACGNNPSSNNLPVDVINIPATADSSVIPTNADQLPELTFEKSNHQFGVITEGEVVEYSFKFENTGKADLLIVSAVASCGCTVPEYPKELIKPGQTAYIKVKYDSNGRVGTFDKTVTIAANTNPRETVISISGEVVAKKKN